MKTDTRTRYSVDTGHGVITRTSARSYAFVVVARGERIDFVERCRVADATYLTQKEREYTDVVEGRRAPLALLTREQYENDFLPHTIDALAGNDAKYDARIAAANVAAEQPFVASSGAWSSRLDLARREHDRLVEYYRDVRIFEVATGREVLATITR